MLVALLLPAGAARRQTSPTPWPAKGDLSLHLSAVKEDVKSGSPVMIKLTLANVSGHKIGLPWERTDLHRNYKLSILDGQGNPVQPVPRFWMDKQGRRHERIWAGSGIVLYLVPGQTREDEANASETYILNRPGRYTVQASWYNYETNT
jgi:hypothetical protein